MAELAVSCPKCRRTVSVPIDGDASDFVCTHCGETSPIRESFDDMTRELTDPLIGRIVAECEVLEKVGEGGFGAVYRAIDTNLDRYVALKVMLQSLTANLEFVQKFIREAVTAAQLNHPNIVAIHKVGRDEELNVHFLIMEYLEGRTLSDVIEEQGALPLDDSVEIVLQCSDALAVAQDKNIIHRDIKPENIMVDESGVVKITDFGLAKTLTTDMKSTKVVGTPHYMSPEQFEGKSVDGRTDIYSLGVTFYHMISKELPYEGTNSVQIIYSILTQEPRDVRDFAEDTPEEVWRIIRKMIAKSLDDRYESFREVHRDLVAFKEQAQAQQVPCPQCSAVNAVGRKFCRECGGSLQIACPACGAENPAGTRHCGECGTDIEGLERIAEQLEQAKKHQVVGDLHGALALYEEVLRLDPVHAEASGAVTEIRTALETIKERKAEADALVERGEGEQALALVEALLGEFPRHEELVTYGKTLRQGLLLRAVDAHLLVARKALEEGRLSDALEAYRSALELDPDRSDIRETLDDLETRIAALDQTLVAAEKALAEGRHGDAFQYAAEVLRLRPDHEGAVQIQRDAREKVESIEAFVQEARDFLERKEYESAAARLEMALQISPGDESVRVLLDVAERGQAELLERLTRVRHLVADDRPEEALEELTEVLREQPELQEALDLRDQAEADAAKRAKARELDARVDEG
ncbi:MAG: protein kinase domain-containing protein, partial [Planctomycetota bacterium]